MRLPAWASAGRASRNSVVISRAGTATAFGRSAKRSTGRKISRWMRSSAIDTGSRPSRGKPQLLVQFNVSNLTDEDEYMPLRYNPLVSGYARVLLLEPRKFRLTVGLEF